MSLDIGGSITTFLILFPAALAVFYVFFYLKKRVFSKNKNKEA